MKRMRAFLFLTLAAGLMTFGLSCDTGEDDCECCEECGDDSGDDDADDEGGNSTGWCDEIMETLYDTCPRDLFNLSQASAVEFCVEADPVDFRCAQVCLYRYLHWDDYDCQDYAECVDECMWYSQ